MKAHAVFFWLFVALAALVASPAGATTGVPRLQDIDDAITELDVARARQLIDQVQVDSPGLAIERARLANYMGDCDTASAILSSPDLESADTAGLAALVRACSGVTAGATVVEDNKRGFRITLQDDADRALVPFITDIAFRARDRVERDLGVSLPRPLRIVMVRDLFSLSAVSGLPLSAAETTGTVAVARWGRVTIISPRATALGYPWEDTMAHEITHLALSRATRDHAPLWLQEGVAKREETRWRAPRPFDRKPDATETARAALLAGRSVGVDKLGPSIAMLPTPEAAMVAFAEVTSFVAYWIEQNGEPALQLLLVDLKGIGPHDGDAAMRSVTGYPFAFWIRRWQAALRSTPAPVASVPSVEPGVKETKMGDIVRRVRLGDLLLARGQSSAAATELDPAVDLAGSTAAIRWRAAKAELGAGHADQARARLGAIGDVDSVVGAWFAIQGRLLRDAGDAKGADRAFRTGIAADPLSEEVACEGFWLPRAPGGAGAPAPPFPGEPARRALCESARLMPRD